MPNDNSNPSATHKPRTMSVPEAGLEYFGIGKNASYEAAKRGEIPTIRVGGLLRALPAVLDRMMEEDPQSDPNPAADAA